VAHRACRSLAISCLFTVLGLAAAGAAPPKAGFTLFGPGNGEIYGVVVDPAAPATLYAVFEHGGVFRSADGGRSWAASGQGLERRRIERITADASGTIYAAARSGSRIEILGSQDHGGTWSPLGSLPRSGDSSLLPRAFLPGGEPGTLYLGVARDLWKSADRGAHWSRVLEAPTLLNTVAAGPAGSPDVYVGTADPGARLLRSADGGATWTAIQDGLPAGAVTALAVAPGRPEKIYAGIGARGLFASEDRGATWRQPDPDFGAIELYAVAVDRAAPATLYAAYRTHHREPFRTRVSRDGGATWESGGLLLAESPPVWGVAIAAAGGTVYATGAIDMAASTDQGRSWTYVWRGGAGRTGNSTDLTQLRFVRGDPATVYSLAGQRAFKSTDGGHTWESFATSLLEDGKTALRDLLCDPADPANLYAAGDTGLFRSSDAGGHWRRYGPPAARLAALPGGTILAGGCGIRYNLRGSDTWEEALSCQVENGGKRSVEKLLPAPAAPGTVYALVAEGEIPAAGERRIYRSRDGGRSWSPIVSGAGVLALSPQPPATLYAVRKNLLLESRDGGDTFRQAGSFGLSAVPNGVDPVADLLVDSAVPTTLYAATRRDGLLRSTDGGASWTLIQSRDAGGDRGIDTPDSLFSLAADPLRPDLLYASPTGVLLRVEVETRASTPLLSAQPVATQ